MTESLSRTQIDRLGDRLRKGPITESDLRLLDDHRRSFRVAYDIVVNTIRDELNIVTTGRPAKSTSSIIEKLRRESIRLSQMQDIAGCRVLVPELTDQDRAVAVLSAAFSDHLVVDRRENPSHGYRAVHVLAKVSGKVIEIQVRTRLQHLWAEVSEKWADIFDPAVKYGGGDETVKRMLLQGSNLVQVSEMLKKARPSDPEVQSLYDQMINGFNEDISWLENQVEGEE